MAALALTVGAAACVQVSPASAELPGPPSFATAVNLDSSSDGAAAVAVGDFNHDGRQDIATAIRTEGLGVFLSTGPGTYGPATKYPAPTGFFGGAKFLVSMIAADLNGDGNVDLVSQDARGDAIDIVWLGDGHGGFATGAAVALNARPGCGGSSTNPCQAAFPLDPQVGDFNEDGKPDIATPAPNTNNIAVVLGNGDGTFGAPAYFPTGASPITSASADVNHDGHMDLLTTQSSSATGQVSLLGDGHGSFAAPVSFASGINLPSHAKFADLNEDGKLDLVVSNGAFVGKASVMLGNGDGTFGTPTLLDTGQNPSSLDLADLNGDGHADLVFGMSRAGAVAVWVGDGHGGFAAPVNYDLNGGVSPFGATIADVNGDGLLDVVTANSNAASNKDVSVLVNTTKVSASVGTTLDARIPAYVALEGGSGSFGDVTPKFTSSLYIASTSLKIATTSPSGVQVSVVAGDPANLNLGGLGEVRLVADANVFDDDNLASWFPLGTSPVALFLSRGPATTSLSTQYGLTVPANKVLRRGDVYSEPITYTATSSVP